MIREAIDKILSLAPPEIFEINGETYCNDLLQLVSKPEYTRPDILGFYTLQAVVDYMAANMDKVDQWLVQIKGPYCVRVLSPLQPANGNERFMYAEARCVYEHFVFDRYMDVDKFIVALQSLFLDSESREALLSIVGNLANEQINSAHDDGISQTVHIKSGITTKSPVTLQNPVTLRPFRTFPEIIQPRSEFIARFRTDPKQGMQVALFEADGGMWQLKAIERIKLWLKEQASLKDTTIIG